MAHGIHGSDDYTIDQGDGWFRLLKLCSRELLARPAQNLFWERQTLTLKTFCWWTKWAKYSKMHRTPSSIRHSAHNPTLLCEWAETFFLFSRLLLPHQIIFGHQTNWLPSQFPPSPVRFHHTGSFGFDRSICLLHQIELIYFGITTIILSTWANTTGLWKVFIWV